MKWEQINSSNINLVLYNKEKKILDIIFSSGSQYRYLNVSVQRYSQFLKSESKGAYFAKSIRPNFKAKKVV